MQSNVTQERVPVHGDQGHWIHVTESLRHVRVFFGDATIADSKRAKLVREPEELPIVLCPGGQLLRNPSEAQLARCVGLVGPIDADKL